MMDEREALVEVLLPHIDDERGFLLPDEHRKRVADAADAILAAGYRLPTTGETAAEDWRADPSANEQWNAGCDYAITQLAAVLGITPDDFSWDAATEELAGDVQSIIGNALIAGLGDDWPDAERRGWEAAAEALDHWGDQEDAAAITCPEADVTVHREREAAFYDAAAWLRAAPRAPDQMQRGTAEPTETCIDCDGTGRYPSGQTCKCCAGSGRVAWGDGVESGDSSGPWASSGERRAPKRDAEIARLRRDLGEARGRALEASRFVRCSQLCAGVGGYGYCSCGAEAVRDALRALAQPTGGKESGDA